MPGGRPTQYTKEMGEKAQQYLSDDKTVNYESRGHAIPSIVGLCRILNVARSTLYLWAKDKDHEFSDILENSNELQELVLINGSLKNELNPTIAKLALGKHGYSEKQDIDLSAKVTFTMDYGDD